MKKTSRLAFELSSLVCSSFLLGCSNEAASSSQSLKTNAFVVTYYDDATTPKKLGTSIVLPHGKAPLPTSFEEGVNYDYTSHSGLDPLIEGSFLGAYWAFSSFAGTYSDGSAVDLNNVTASVDVKASFEAKKYTYSANYFNKSIALRDAEGNAVKETLNYGLTPSFPTGVQDSSPLWYQDSTFLGFSLKKDTNATPLANGSLLAFTAGEGAPSVAAALGSLYFDTSVKSDTFNRDFPAYYSNGASWIDLGMSLKSGLSLDFEAAYSTSYKAFAVSFYPEKTIDTEKNIVPQGTALSATPLSVTYLDSISFAIAGTTTTVTYGSKTLTLTTSATPTSWVGVYTEGTNFKNQAVDATKIQQACFFYPVY
jgi:uncharacterized lipoprotein NlpE involved in copper resistance